MQTDRNFDTLIERFRKTIYNTAKGSWRLKLLQEDLQPLYEQPEPLAIWDAGCGFGQMSLWFAAQGHQLTLCDLSKKMLAHAQAQFKTAELEARFLQGAAQQLASTLPQFDLVLFHAVLEWLAEPLATLPKVAEKVKPGGYLSLMFYNRNAVVYKNALRGHWRLKQLLDHSYLGKGKKLTPPNPQYPHDVIAALDDLGFTIFTQTGIRVFHDYLEAEALEKSDDTELFELEYQYCRLPTFRDMGRYIHILAQRQ